MRKEKSWTRTQYDSVYRDLRFFMGDPFRDFGKDVPKEIYRAADYNYQARGHYVNGWIDDRRWLRFCDKRGVLPF